MLEGNPKSSRKIVVPDGYGLAYSIDASYIRWTITCLKTKSQEGKGTKELKNALEQAALEVRDMMESAKKERESKL